MLTGISDTKTATRNNRRNVLAAKTDMSIGLKHRIRQEAGSVVICIDRSWSETVRENWVIRRNRRCHHFINANPGAAKSAVEASNKAGGVSVIRTIKQGALLHGAMKLAATNNFKSISHAAAELALHIGTTSEERNKCCAEQEGQRTDFRISLF